MKRSLKRYLIYVGFSLVSVLYHSCLSCKIYDLDKARIVVPAGGNTVSEQQWRKFDTMFLYNYAVGNWDYWRYYRAGHLVVVRAPHNIQKKFSKLCTKYWGRKIKGE